MPNAWDGGGGAPGRRRSPYPAGPCRTDRPSRPRRGGPLADLVALCALAAFAEQRAPVVVSELLGVALLPGLAPLGVARRAAQLAPAVVAGLLALEGRLTRGQELRPGELRGRVSAVGEVRRRTPLSTMRLVGTSVVGHRILTTPCPV
ncbi:hypothetical protein ACFQX6_50700 [Streptosporangium lutulentum]